MKSYLLYRFTQRAWGPVQNEISGAQLFLFSKEVLKHCWYLDVHLITKKSIRFGVMTIIFHLNYAVHKFSVHLREGLKSAILKTFECFSTYFLTHCLPSCISKRQSVQTKEFGDGTGGVFVFNLVDCPVHSLVNSIAPRISPRALRALPRVRWHLMTP